jgi:hypothetical protein
MANISEMISKVNRYGVVQQNNYKVVFSGLVGQSDAVIGSPGGLNNFDTRMSLSCDSVSIPGRSLSTNEFKTIGVGREVPYQQLFSGDLAMTFVFGKDMFERKVFETWMDYIVNPVNNRFKYYDDYVATVDVVMFDSTESPVYKAHVEEVYPKEIGPIELSNSGSDLARQTVTFSFRKYVPIDVSEANGGFGSSVPSGFNNVSSFLGSLNPNIGSSNIGSDVLDWVERGRQTYERYADSGSVVKRKLKNFNVKNMFGRFL